MVCLGSKILQRKVSQHQSLVKTRDMPGEDDMSDKRGTKRMKKKIGSKRGNAGSTEPDNSAQTSGKKNTGSSRHDDGRETNKRSFKHSSKDGRAGKGKQSGGLLAPQPSVLRRKVDPETAKYFLEISNLFESNEVDLEERPFICANALGEARGKEVELATDMVISRTLQTLLEDCDLDQLCSFLQGCAKGFSSIAMDKYGSHVAETALKSLAVHLEDQEALPMIENSLNKICQATVVDPVDIMSSSYGSHVIRSLLCLCKGVPLDSLEEFHVTKASAILAERLNIKSPPFSGNNSSGFQQGFPDLLKFLITELLKHAGDEITTLRVNKYSSFILQTALKLLVGDDHEVMQVILAILGFSEENISDGLFLGSANIEEIMDLLKDTSSSHLVEVILEVAPENLYHEILEKVFKGSLFEISSHHCGNFVVQALIASSRCKGQVDMIWDELCPKIKELLVIGKSGVVASLLAACQRFQTHNRECCEVLASSVCSESEHPSCIIPHLLFLESYLSCKDTSSWKWPTGDRMHVLGCLMLQTVFRYSKQFMDPYIESMVLIESDQILEIAKDPGGSRVLESFLSSDAHSKQKLEVISKLQNHFGELSLHPSGSFTVEKCFTASNLLLKETIVSELAYVKEALSKTKHGPYIMRKLDVDRYVVQPKHWKSRQAAKEAVFRDFQAAFVSSESTVAAQLSQSNQKKRDKRSKSAISRNDRSIGDPDFSSPSGPEFHGLEVPMSDLGVSGVKCDSKRGRNVGGAAAPIERLGKKLAGNSTGTFFLRHGKRKASPSELTERQQPTKRKSSSSELADLAGKGALSAGEFRKLFKGTADQVKQS